MKSKKLRKILKDLCRDAREEVFNGERANGSGCIDKAIERIEKTEE